MWQRLRRFFILFFFLFRIRDAEKKIIWKNKLPHNSKLCKPCGVIAQKRVLACASPRFAVWALCAQASSPTPCHKCQHSEPRRASACWFMFLWALVRWFMFWLGRCKHRLELPEKNEKIEKKEKNEWPAHPAKNTSCFLSIQKLSVKIFSRSAFKLRLFLAWQGSYHRPAPPKAPLDGDNFCRWGKSRENSC